MTDQAPDQQALLNAMNALLAKASSLSDLTFEPAIG